MLAYVVAGLVMGALAWYLAHDAGDPRLPVQLAVGVLGALAGGLVANLVVGEGVPAVTAWGFAAAVVVAAVVLSLLQPRAGRGAAAGPPRG